MRDERRTEDRVEMSLEANWWGMSGMHGARIGDISLGGCFIDTRGAVTVGEVVTFELKLPDGEWLELRGQVTFYQPGVGFSLCFTFLTDEEQRQLAQVITA